MKYTNEQLDRWAIGDLVFPPNIEKHYEQRDEILKAMMPGIDLKENEDLVSELSTFELWSDLSAIINDLAEMLLSERKEREEVLKDARRDLQDSIRNLDALINGKSE